MWEHLVNGLPFPWHGVFPNPYFPFYLSIQPFLAFDFHLLSHFVRYGLIA
jgi:hypothetical protein